MDDDDAIDDKVEIFSNDDLKLKYLGQILSSESSRKILILVAKQEISANDIAQETDLRLSLIIHHLNKMIRAGVVKVNKIGKTQKATT